MDWILYNLAFQNSCADIEARVRAACPTQADRDRVWRSVLLLDATENVPAAPTHLALVDRATTTSLVLRSFDANVLRHLQSLLAGGAFPQLQTLTLLHGGFDEDALAAVLRARGDTLEALFISDVAGMPDGFVARALTTLCPGVVRVGVTTNADVEWAVHSAPRPLRQLTCTSGVPLAPDTVAALTSRHHAALDTLNVSVSSAALLGLATAIAAGALPHLRDLQLRLQRVSSLRKKRLRTPAGDEDGAAVLVVALVQGVPQTLQHLRLHGDIVSDACCALLPRLPRLATLSLQYCPSVSAIVWADSSSQVLVHLAEMVVDNNALARWDCAACPAGSLAALASVDIVHAHALAVLRPPPSLPALRKLSLGGYRNTAVRTADVSAVCAVAPLLESLRLVLGRGGRQLDLGAPGQLPALRTFSLWDPSDRITGAIVESLAAAAPGLRELHIQSDGGFRTFALPPDAFASLERCDLGYCPQLEPDAILSLSRCAGAQTLTSLRYGSSTHCAALRGLRPGAFPRLAELQPPFGTPTTAAAVRELAAACPAAQSLSLRGAVDTRDGPLRLAAGSCPGVETVFIAQVPLLTAPEIVSVLEACPQARTVSVGQCPEADGSFVSSLPRRIASFSAHDMSRLGRLSAVLPLLTTVTLERCTLSVAALEDLLAHSPALETLSLTGCSLLGEPAASAVPPPLAHLTKVSLSGVRGLSDAVMVRLLHPLGSAVEFSLAAAEQVVAPAIADPASALSRCTTLSLYSCPCLESTAVSALLQVERGSLQTLNLQGCRSFGSHRGGPPLVAVAGSLPQLRYADLSQTAVSDADVVSLCLAAPQLEHLAVRCCDGLDRLAGLAPGCIPQLAAVDVRFSSLSRDGVRALSVAAPALDMSVFAQMNPDHALPVEPVGEAQDPNGVAAEETPDAPAMAPVGEAQDPNGVAAEETPDAPAMAPVGEAQDPNGVAAEETPDAPAMAPVGEAQDPNGVAAEETPDAPAMAPVGEAQDPNGVAAEETPDAPAMAVPVEPVGEEKAAEEPTMTLRWVPIATRVAGREGRPPLARARALLGWVTVSFGQEKQEEDALLVFGGHGGERALGVPFLLRGWPLKPEWVPLHTGGAQPGARFGAAMGVLPDRAGLVAAGGMSNEGEQTPDTHTLDLVSREWRPSRSQSDGPSPLLSGMDGEPWLRCVTLRHGVLYVPHASSEPAHIYAKDQWHALPLVAPSDEDAFGPEPSVVALPCGERCLAIGGSRVHRSGRIAVVEIRVEMAEGEPRATLRAVLTSDSGAQAPPSTLQGHSLVMIDAGRVLVLGGRIANAAAAANAVRAHVLDMRSEPVTWHRVGLCGDVPAGCALGMALAPLPVLPPSPPTEAGTVVALACGGMPEGATVPDDAFGAFALGSECVEQEPAQEAAAGPAAEATEGCKTDFELRDTAGNLLPWARHLTDGALARWVVHHVGGRVQLGGGRLGPSCLAPLSQIHSITSLDLTECPPHVMASAEGLEALQQVLAANTQLAELVSPNKDSFPVVGGVDRSAPEWVPKDRGPPDDDAMDDDDDEEEEEEEEEEEVGRSRWISQEEWEHEVIQPGAEHDDHKSQGSMDEYQDIEAAAQGTAVPILDTLAAHCPRLRRLVLGPGAGGDALIPTLARAAPQLTQLTSLSFRHGVRCPCGDYAAVADAVADALTPLAASLLEFAPPRFGERWGSSAPAALVLLPALRRLTQLTALDLSASGSVADTAVLDALPSTLVLLTLGAVPGGANGPVDAAVVRLAQRCPGLQALRIPVEEMVSDVAMDAVAAHCPQLRALEMPAWATASALASVARHATALTALSLCGRAPIGADAWGALGRSCEQLSAVCISGAGPVMDDAGLKALVDARGPTLRTIELGCQPGISDDGLVAVGAHCLRLREIIFPVNASEPSGSGLVTVRALDAVTRGCPEMERAVLQYDCLWAPRTRRTREQWREGTDRWVVAVTTGWEHHLQSLMIHCDNKSEAMSRTNRDDFDYAAFDEEYGLPQLVPQLSRILSGCPHLLHLHIVPPEETGDDGPSQQLRALSRRFPGVDVRMMI